MQNSISQLPFAILAENKAIQEELRKYSSLPPPNMPCYKFIKLHKREFGDNKEDSRQ